MHQAPRSIKENCQGSKDTEVEKNNNYGGNYEIYG